MTDIAKNPKDLEPVRLDAHCEWNVNALNKALWAAHSQSEETGADYKSVCNVLADLHHVLATAPTPLVMLRRAATAVLNTLPTEEECRDVALWGQFEVAREVAERVRAESDLLYALARDSNDVVPPRVPDTGARDGNDGAQSDETDADNADKLPDPTPPVLPDDPAVRDLVNSVRERDRKKSLKQKPINAIARDIVQKAGFTGDEASREVNRITRERRRFEAAEKHRTS